jgi:hypothetical protein
MENSKIIIIFLGIASAIAIFTFQKAGIMEGENAFMIALQPQKQVDSVLLVEKSELIRSIDSAIANIETQLTALTNKKNQKGENEKLHIDEQIDILTINKANLHDKKLEIVNELWNERKQTDSLFQSPKVRLHFIQNS